MKKYIAGILTGVLLMIAIPVLGAEVTKTIQVVFDKVKLNVNGQMTDTPTMLYEGRTYVQLLGASEAFDAELRWEAETNTAYLTAKEAQGIMPVETEVPITEGYILNTSKMRFHKVDCVDIPKISDKNYAMVETREEAIEGGYIPCGNCQP